MLVGLDSTLGHQAWQVFATDQIWLENHKARLVVDLLPMNFLSFNFWGSEKVLSEI